jgi:hypothetical protein
MAALIGPPVHQLEKRSQSRAQPRAAEPRGGPSRARSGPDNMDEFHKLWEETDEQLERLRQTLRAATTRSRIVLAVHSEPEDTRS